MDPRTLGQRLDGTTQRRAGLVEHDLVAGVHGSKRRSQATEPAADDRDFHSFFTLSAVRWGQSGVRPLPWPERIRSQEVRGDDPELGRR